MRRILSKMVLPVMALIAISNLPVVSSPPPINEIPAGYIPSGEAMYTQYCAACHGAEGRGMGLLPLCLRGHPPI
jgi:mono/diheme cytochrome c family protein